MVGLKELLAFAGILALCGGKKYLGQPLSYCLSSDPDPYLFLGSKTSYSVSRGNAGSESTCKPIQFWSINRHGSRYASPTELQGMKLATGLQDSILKNYASGLAPKEDPLCADDLLALTAWKWDETIENKTYDLTTEGWKELKKISARYQKRYPELLTGYSPEQFYFRHTNEQRTWASCRASIEGLFGSYENITIEEPKQDDEVIRPYNMCPEWSTQVADNADFRDKQQIIFRTQSDYQTLLTDISKRLGFSENLNYEAIDNMYNNCCYDKSLRPTEVSAWCSVFTKPELHLLEYYEDLGHYYKSGFSHPFNPKLGCMPWRHMMETFNKTVADKVAKPRVINMYSHDTLLNLMFTTVGFGKDGEPLMGTGYESLLLNRTFRSSLHTPFAGNIAVILHECSSGDYEAQFYLNEKPMELDGCPKGVCSWEYLKEFLKVTETCNLDFCNL